MTSKLKARARSFSFLITFLLATACVQKSSSLSFDGDFASPAAGIVNGKEAQASDLNEGGLAQSVVALDIGGQGCTGTLIAPTLVLTAAHCTFFAARGNYGHVYFRVLNTNDDGADNNEIAVKNFVVHPKFRNGGSWSLDQAIRHGNDDLAVLQLETPVPVEIKPAVLAMDDKIFSQSEAVTAVGYGKSSYRYGDMSGSGRLRSTSFKSGELSATQRMILAKSADSGVCHGDSGGPLFAGNAEAKTNILVGVIDFTTPLDFSDRAIPGNDMERFMRAHPKQDMCLGIGGFVDVAKHRQWILETAAAFGAPIQ